MINKISINVDKSLLNIDVIYKFLSNSYWANDRTKEEIQTSIDHSFCFGVYKNSEQIGFGRIISDTIIYAYMMDVFIIDEEQGNGYGKQLIQYILDYPPLINVKKWTLGTRDAMSFYIAFGFEYIDDKPYKIMEKKA